MYENIVRINHLLSKDKLHEGLEALAPLAEKAHRDEWLMYSSQLAGLTNDKNNGEYSSSELDRRRNAIRLRLISLLNDIANEKGISLEIEARKNGSDFIPQHTNFRQLIWQTLIGRKWQNIYFWVGVLLVIIVIFHKLIYQFLPENIFSNTLLWGSIVVPLFIIAFTKAVYHTYRQISARTLSPSSYQSSIKGLHPYTSDDWEVFQKLQRDKELSRCIHSIEHTNFQIGVLSGMSGCGKTSFLQAGLKPALERKEFQIIYVKFSDENPVESVKNSLRKEQGIQYDQGDLLKDCIAKIQNLNQNKPILLLFDQFEQFFTNFSLSENQQTFLKQLKEVLTSFNSDGVKILISVRSDFFSYIIDFQRELEFSLSADVNYFDLKKFTPHQAKEIFRVFAEKEKLISMKNL